ncbi:MAG: hypothetical protein O7H40_06970 [Gammaproteobacteria bacterium]|nr:hypothetical protein [Gammaproteobacteria bacterium]
MKTNLECGIASLSRAPAILLLCVLAWAGFATADQTDQRLAGMFSELANADNPIAGNKIEQEIWAIWLAAPDPQVNEWLDEARAATNSGAITSALEIFDRVTATYPNFAEGWNQRAIMHFLLGDFESSLSDIARTLELEPRHFGALAGSGQCYLRLELFQESLISFEAALQVNPWMSAARQQVEMLRAYLNQQQTPI